MNAIVIEKGQRRKYGINKRKTKKVKCNYCKVFYSASYIKSHRDNCTRVFKNKQQVSRCDICKGLYNTQFMLRHQSKCDGTLKYCRHKSSV